MAQDRIAITLGDPAGIGPEVVAKCFAAWADPAHAQATFGGRVIPLVIGPAWGVRQGCALAAPSLRLRTITDPSEARGEPGTIDVLDVDEPEPEGMRMGEVSAACGRAAVRTVELTARLAMAGHVRAMVTSPIHKEAVHAAGYIDDIGHQEILARITGAGLTATMLMTPGLRCAHLSTHKSLADAVRYVTRANVVAKARLTHDSLQAWGLRAPRIAIAALNPHGGEGGLLGREEIEELQPAVLELRAAGIDARGPLPADSVFVRAIAGEFDAVLALYHDQGHIPIKVQNFHDSVTVTMGIPFIRTSVDHGTAFDIAGRGIADPTSLLRAVEMASTLVLGELRAFIPPAAGGHGAAAGQGA